MASEFMALLWRDLMAQLLLHVRERPSPKEIERRARVATELSLRLHPAGPRLLET